MIKILERSLQVMNILLLCACLILFQICFLYADDEKKMRWTEKKSAYAEIQVQEAGSGVIQRFTLAAGRILSHPDHISYVLPKVEGVVHAVYKNLGDRVQKGEILAIIESKELIEVKSNYLLSLHRKAIQKEFLKKESALRGVSAEQDYLMAKLAFQEAEIEYECALHKLYSLGFSEEDVKKDISEHRFYELKAPFRGRILNRNVTLGEKIDDSTRAFTVGNFAKVWVEIHVAPDDVCHLREGLDVEIISADEERVCAHVCHLNPIISEKTRMATAIAVLDNPSKDRRPGQYVSVSILTKTLQLPLVIPKEAIQTMKGEKYIFRECEGNFIPCKVQLGKMDTNSAEVLSGLRVGDRYVSVNAFSLKADYEKDEVEE